MNRSKRPWNWHGKNGGCRSHRHAYTMARLQMWREMFMPQRTMRRYWQEPRGPLYGPLGLMSNWLRFRVKLDERVNDARDPS